MELNAENHLGGHQHGDRNVTSELSRKLFNEYLGYIKDGLSHTEAWRKTGMYEELEETQLEVRRMIDSLGIF